MAQPDRSTDLKHAHRLLCAAFVDETLFRQALGAGRSDLGSVARYLALPVLERPALSYYFDAGFYLARNPDLHAAQIDPLLHFLEFGVEEHRAPHPLIDIAYIQTTTRGALGTPARIDTLAALLETDVRPSPWFDPTWYADQLDRPPAQGRLRHFLTQGVWEGRQPCATLDPDWYAARHPDVPADPYEALSHFIHLGEAMGRIGAAPDDAPAPLESLAGWHEQMARFQAQRASPPCPPVLLPPGVMDRLAFPPCHAPRLSILVPAFNQAAATLQCLLALRDRWPSVPTEVILADDASDDPAMARFASVPNLVLHRQPMRVGFLHNTNSAFTRCRGAYVLLLNNDTEIQPDAIDHMVAALDADATLGAVGAKLIYPDGRLQEAGCALRQDGSSIMIGLGEDPDSPGHCYDRDVQYCSAAALMLRAGLIDGALFDTVFAPAYCEDVDLCLRLRAAGYRVRYLHQALVVHHLSLSTEGDAERLRLVQQNQQTLLERWGTLLAEQDAMRAIAFYLPQFHPIPENEMWWGAGFTEWTNVSRARPSFSGHDQPHLPADLGYYDLRLPDVLRRQAMLAARYGLSGFCVYSFVLGGRRRLQTPIETVLANPDIPFRWCLCWANENWTRSWDGGDGQVLLQQDHDAETLGLVIDDAIRQARDPRYLTVDGRPILLVYRALHLPDATGFTASCRARFAAAGFPGVYLACVESTEMAEGGHDPRSLGFDAAVEFPPHGLLQPSQRPRQITRPGWSGQILDYQDNVAALVNRPAASYPRHPGLFPGWDSTPRHPRLARIYDGAEPAAWRAFADAQLDRVRQHHVGAARLLFINAWNEWAEGAHLEPDVRHGHGWLEALRDALDGLAWR